MRRKRKTKKRRRKKKKKKGVVEGHDMLLGCRAIQSGYR
jgi:hypothetical protein